jgi:osmotically inducible protein OsmC
MPTSSANAVWEGGLKAGNGSFEARSGAFRGEYSFPTRFEGTAGTNPEELLAAAHAACLSMALAAGLEGGGTPPQRIATTASCTIEKVDGAFRVSTMHLEVHGAVPGIDQAAFAAAADAAKQGCPVSNALTGIKTVTMRATLE